MLRCLIVDDEPFATELIESYVERVPFLKLEAIFNDAINASEFLRKSTVDLIFLDIQMPHINGIQLLRSLDHPPMVIFTTAFHQYAVEGFELDAVDYLLKPFDFDRFMKAVNKVYEYFQLKSFVRPEESYLFVKADYQQVKIPIGNIQFIECWDDYVKIYTGAKPILTLMSLKAILELLPPNEFIRIHRSYIVPVHKIESIRNKMIRIGDKEIPVGTTYVDEVKNLLHNRQK